MKYPESSTDVIVRSRVNIDRVDEAGSRYATWRLECDFELYENALIRAVKGFIERFKANNQ